MRGSLCWVVPCWVSGMGECFREEKLMSLDLVSFWGETNTILSELVCLGLGAAVPANELSLSARSVPCLCKEGVLLRLLSRFSRVRLCPRVPLGTPPALPPSRPRPVRMRP